MSNCRDKEIQLACFTPDDGSPSVTINHTVVYDSEGKPIATYFSDREGVVIDENDYLGGGVAEIGSCAGSQVDCIESQEWTYGIDNTGTRFNDIADYEIDLSDGTKLYFSQDGSSTSWTPQLIEWSANIQQAADDAGLAWFVEPRFIDNYNPSNIDGTVNGPGGSPSGLPGAPSEVVAQTLFDGGMAWRYVNIQICPGQPVPVAARRLTSTLYNPPEIELTTAGPVLGPLQRFFVCRNCSEEPVWYLEDGVTLAEEGQIPNCYLPCGFLSLQENPPGRTCDFVFAEGCDNNNSTDPANFSTGITRRLTVCEGVVSSVTFFQEDPNDETALIPYDLVGSFVDCASGFPVDEPQPECSSTTYIGKLYKLEGSPEVGTNVDWWATSTFPGGSNAAPHGNVSDIFTNDGSTLTHVNGAPDASFVNPTFAIIGTQGQPFLGDVGAASNAETSGTDQLKLSGYIILDKPGILRDVNVNTGERGGIAVNICCAGELEWKFERTTDTVNGDVGVFDGVRLPAGIHYIEAVTSDLSAWQGLQLSVSFDDGETYEPFVSYTSKPSYVCRPVIRCEESGVLLDGETEELIEVGPFDTWCEPKGCEPCCVGDSNSENTEVQYTTSFDSQFFSSAFAVPTAPADTKEVVVFNNSNAWLEFTTNYGTQIVPPGGTASWEVNDYEAGITFSSVSLINGNFSGNDNWGINFRSTS